MARLALIIGISFVAGAVTVVVLQLKSRVRGELHDNPPFARHVTAYFAAYVAGFTALERLEPLWASLVMTAVAALAFAVTLNGRKSLLSAEYARTAGATFMAVAAIWLIYQLLLLAGIDLLAEDFKSASEMFTVVPESEA